MALSSPPSVSNTECPPVRGLVVGAYGEASADVHALLKLTAAKKAETAFKEMGARTPIEAEATLTLSLRRHWGLTFVREYARMRLARVCFVGAPRCIRTAQAFSSSHCAHDDHSASVFSVHALHARLRGKFGPTDHPSWGGVWLRLVALYPPVPSPLSRAW